MLVGIVYCSATVPEAPVVNKRSVHHRKEAVVEVKIQNCHAGSLLRWGERNPSFQGFGWCSLSAVSEAVSLLECLRLPRRFGCHIHAGPVCGLWFHHHR